jgi:hypothetical protein
MKRVVLIELSATMIIGALAVAGAGGPLAAPALAASTEALAPDAPWRVFLVCSQPDKRRKAPPTYTAAPPAGWTGADFDDSAWGRYGADLVASVGGYGFGQSPQTAMLCLRTWFGVTDPSQVQDLVLALEYRGGAVVYVNGREVARQHVPPGPLEPATPAEAYPAEAFSDPGGAALPAADRPAEEHRDRYEKRIRRLSVTLPRTALRKGGNVLAIGLHHAPTGPMQGGRTEWSTAGLCDVALTSRSGAGVAAYADALTGVTVWNATPMDTVAVTPGKRQAGFLWWGVTITPVGLTRGNPFEPVRPIRTVAPRGGTCSGQVVVTGPGPLKGLRAAIGPLRQAGGQGAIPAEAVRVAYATQADGEVFSNALQPHPADGPAVQPVWVLVDVPRNQPPGWYAGTLTLTLGPQTTRVPVEVLVAAWTVTDPKDNGTFVSLYQSPDTLADHFQVEPWSARHFALIEQAMGTMAGMGGDVLLVPVILDNYLHHKTGLVRWVRKGGGHVPEFSALERYLDLHTRAFGRPKVVTLSVWKHAFGCRTWFRGMKSDTVGPCLVTELDPSSGRMAPMEAPHFGRPGSEAFWKALIEGVRGIVKARGGDERFVLLGEAFDSRPLQPVVDFFEKIEPGMRWQMYAHWVKEAPAQDGRLTALGGFQIGLRINPNNGGLPEFDRKYPDVPPADFYTVQTHRTAIHHTSSPLSYRVVMRSSGTLARIGLDFWPIFTDDRGRRRSYYGCPPNEGWLWRGHSPAITAPGPGGAVRTTRGQMLLEGLQETELLLALIRAQQKAAPPLAARIEQCLAARREADVVGKALSQAMISLDLAGLAAREYALGAELSGGAPPAAGQGDWHAPPSAPGGPR